MRKSEPNPVHALAFEEQRSRTVFSALRRGSIVRGEFHDRSWDYSGRHLTFITLAGDPLEGTSETIARCIVAQEIALGRSPEAVYSRLMAVRLVDDKVGSSLEAWHRLSGPILSEIVSALRRKASDATVYHRATALGVLVGQLRMFGEEGARFLRVNLKWRHGVENPCRAIIGYRVSEPGNSLKYIPDLHLAIGNARARVAASPEIEPAKGYDRIRLESLAFASALGLRSAEIGTLSRNALGHEDSVGTAFLRVFTVKGGGHGVRPIGQVWLPMVAEAFDYLLSECSDARKRAHDIELHGMEFVARELKKLRRRNGISSELRDQLKVMGLSEDTHYSIEEVISVFNVSSKTFTQGGGDYKCVRALPRIVAARFASWLDERFRRWDWDAFTSDVGVYRCAPSLSALQVGRLAGISRSCIPKARWFINDLRRLLAHVQALGVLTGRQCSRREIADARRRWDLLRKTMLAPRGGGKCTVVDIEAWSRALNVRYLSYLERHYKHCLSEEVVSANKHLKATRLPPLSEHLIVLWEGQFSGSGEMGVIPRPLSHADLYNYLCSSGAKTTIFQRLDICDDSGKPFSITPHQIRHWLTTAMLRSGPSEMMADLWFGRTPGQTRHYDHRTPFERAEKARLRYLSDAGPPDDHYGRLVTKWRSCGASEEEVTDRLRSRLRVTNFVPWGECSQDLFTSPCSKGLMCLRGFGTEAGCRSFHLDPKDQAAKDQIEALRAKYQLMLSAIEPEASAIRDTLRAELNAEAELDQHIAFLIDMLQSCERAIACFEEQSASQHGE